MTTQRILLVQLADIGDLILTTPALDALREALPDAHLTLLTTAHAAPVIPDGMVDVVITFDRSQFNSSRALLRPDNLWRVAQLRRGGYDTVVFFHHFTLRLGTLKFWLIAKAAGVRHRLGLQNGNGWFLTDSVPDDGFGARHQAAYWLSLVGLLGADESPRPARVAVDQTPDLHPKAADRPRVVIHAGSGGYSLARRWEPEGFARVADRLHAERSADVVLVGGKDDDSAAVKDAMTVAPQDVTGKTTLPGLAGLLQTADLFIGADSGVMHLAAAAGAPIVALFGPSNESAWCPWMPGGGVDVVRTHPVCAPCSYVGHGIGLRDGCQARTCMRMITAEHVLRAAYRRLDGQPEPESDDRPPQPLERTWKRQSILGLPVDGITYAELLDQIAAWVEADDGAHQICTINPEFMMIARQDPNFRHILQRADLNVPDGVGLLWAARACGQRLPERVTGSDGVPMIAERAAQEGWRLYLLGGAPEIAEQAADALCRRFPGLQIAGTYAGSPAGDEEDAIVERVNASGADVLFVAYGAPRQDKWIARNLFRLDVSMAMGVGGALDFAAGTVPRAPGWMQKLGLEWLYRLYLQPWRIKRMMRLPRFVLAVWLEKRRLKR